MSDIPLASLTGRIAIFFRPSGRWAVCHSNDLISQLELIDFTRSDCQPQDCLIGAFGPALAESEFTALEPLVFGQRDFGPDDAEAYLATIDWHGTPSYFIARDCHRGSEPIRMGLLAVEPIVRVIAAYRIAEVRALLEGRVPPAAPHPQPAAPGSAGGWLRRLVQRLRA